MQTNSTQATEKLKPTPSKPQHLATSKNKFKYQNNTQAIK